MKVLCLSACVLVASAAAASAQSGAPATSRGATNWTGPYVGLTLGYGSASAAVETRGLNGPGAGPVIGPLFENTVNAIRNNRRPGRLDINGSGIVGGAVAGYNYQPNPGGGLVFGVETDLTATSIRADATSIGSFNEPSRISQRTDFVGTVRGRVGVAFDNVLVYATGGFAYARTATAASFSEANGGPVAFAGRSNSLVSGAVYGGGVEVRVPRGSPLNPLDTSTMTIGASLHRIHFASTTTPILSIIDPRVGFASKPDDSTTYIGVVRTTFTF